MSVAELGRFLKDAAIGEPVHYLKAHPSLASFLDRETGAGNYKMLVSETTTSQDRVMKMTVALAKRPYGMTEGGRSEVALDRPRCGKRAVGCSC
jgi:hypothetical protein